MAEHLPAGPAEVGAPMDYGEHERTYSGFISLTKVIILATADTMLALTLFAFGRGGFWLGSLLLLLVMIATVIAIIGKGSLKPLAIVAVVGILFLALSVG